MKTINIIQFIDNNRNGILECLVRVGLVAIISGPIYGLAYNCGCGFVGKSIFAVIWVCFAGIVVLVPKAMFD